jgi:CRISPR/Cas system CMR-associated protein Cmr5 small subunit
MKAIFEKQKSVQIRFSYYAKKVPQMINMTNLNRFFYEKEGSRR